MECCCTVENTLHSFLRLISSWLTYSFTELFFHAVRFQMKELVVRNSRMDFRRVVNDKDGHQDPGDAQQTRKVKDGWPASGKTVLTQ